MSETSSPTVVPALTKTDARALASLVKKDTSILLDELDSRREDFVAQAYERRREAQAGISAIRDERDAEDVSASNAAMARIQRRVTSLNEDIIKVMTDLSDAGWAGRGGAPFDPHRFTVDLPDTHHLVPPDRDNSDLDDRLDDIRDENNEIDITIEAQYQAARRGLQTDEATVHRSLILQSITTEAAAEFVLSMPEVEDLLPVPEALQALEA